MAQPMSQRFAALFTPLLLLLALSACSLTPTYQRPGMTLPENWRDNPTLNATATSDGTSADWWAFFGDAELNRMIAEALANNMDLQAGIQRVAQARASLRIAGGSVLPAVDASAGAARTHTDPATGAATTDNTLKAGATLAYEVDLFGRNRAGIAAATENLKATTYTQQALELSVVGAVSTGYFTVLNLRDRLEIAERNLANAKDILQIERARVKAGAASELELAQQETVVANNEAAHATLVQQVRNAENAIAVLLGRAPEKNVVKPGTLAAAQVPALGAVQPATLLARRPDLRAAEAKLRAANADIGAARAALFPSLSLGVTGSLSSAGFNQPAAQSLAVSSSLLAPIFQGGQLAGGVDLAKARQRELVEVYRQAVLTAFQEVEDALAEERAAQSRETFLAHAAAQADKAYQLAKDRYDAGAIDFQTMLNTQASQLAAEDNFAQAKLARLSAAVNLFMALGGGWDVPPAAQP